MGWGTSQFLKTDPISFFSGLSNTSLILVKAVQFIYLLTKRKIIWSKKVPTYWFYKNVATWLWCIFGDSIDIFSSKFLINQLNAVISSLVNYCITDIRVRNTKIWDDVKMEKHLSGDLNFQFRLTVDRVCIKW